MHVNQVRLAEKTDSISWEEQPSEWTAADTGSNEIENRYIRFRILGGLLQLTEKIPKHCVRCL